MTTTNATPAETQREMRRQVYHMAMTTTVLIARGKLPGWHDRLSEPARHTPLASRFAGGMPSFSKLNFKWLL